ncbi:MAG: 6-carboxytetrahydropterin synthase QueD [Candidatus Omnitrophica bacterium]|nr:6-carboxytetrahydropterin synthase QueD [Candidatus Omnitrophota bacterium]
MYEVTVTSYFSAAHRLRNYKGKCENLHGHNWKVSVTVSRKKLDNTGMVMDFGALKNNLHGILSKLDHAFLNETPYFKKNNPTSENIARFISESIKKIVAKERVKVTSVSVWETESSRAVFRDI